MKTLFGLPDILLTVAAHFMEKRHEIHEIMLIFSLLLLSQFCSLLPGLWHFTVLALFIYAAVFSAVIFSRGLIKYFIIPPLLVAHQCWPLPHWRHLMWINPGLYDLSLSLTQLPCFFCAPCAETLQSLKPEPEHVLPLISCLSLAPFTSVFVLFFCVYTVLDTSMNECTWHIMWRILSIVYDIAWDMFMSIPVNYGFQGTFNIFIC